MCEKPVVLAQRYWTISNSSLEIALLALLWVVVVAARGALDVPGATWTLGDVALLGTLSSLVRRAYTAHLEACYYKYPQLRTQPPKKAVGETPRDVTGRTDLELATIDFHDRFTMLSKLFACDLLFYLTIGRILYPVFATSHNPVYWLARVVGHHYVLSFGMYWAHRNLHVNPFLWRHIHSLHHYAKTPLARATYEDHWLDNYANAIVSEVATQIILPLPKPLLFASRLFRVCESLEKHSGMSGPINVAHTAQFWLPFAQMPHHHDWHHEGHKGSNYTFASIGGLWDFLFGTRHPGRSAKNAARAATYRDANQNAAEGGKKLKSRYTAFLDNPVVCAVPPLLFFAVAVQKVAMAAAAAAAAS
ncbi:hypothetical protein CTAYLR_001200 [Chrysophaeum taylorii]|uniref:Fatty acid hydroxylase domain-containing protein n=1 Tax=Chrysophaeum taylorii TaxID=2483200 RepID=A0AAD7UE74_9STRA|nr:hypothetical protein CTAYLR_001200 [Chrysophaeum taylorii]